MRNVSLLATVRARAVFVALTALSLAIPASPGLRADDEFPPSTLAAIAALNGGPPPARGYTINLAATAFSTRVNYRAEFRPLAPELRRFLDHWTFSTGRPAFSALYTTEVRVDESGTPHWIPVQREIERFLRDERRDGDPIIARLRHLGRLDGGAHVFVLIGYVPADASAAR